MALMASTMRDVLVMGSSVAADDDGDDDGCWMMEPFSCILHSHHPERLASKNKSCVIQISF